MNKKKLKILKQKCLFFGTRIKSETKKKETIKKQRRRWNNNKKKRKNDVQRKNQEVKQKMSLKLRKKKQEKSRSTKKKTRGCKIRRVFVNKKELLSNIIFTVVSWNILSFYWKIKLYPDLFGHSFMISIFCGFFQNDLSVNHPPFSFRCCSSCFRSPFSFSFFISFGETPSVVLLFLFRLFLTFFNLVLSKNNPFLRKISFSLSTKIMFSEFHLG